LEENVFGKIQEAEEVWRKWGDFVFNNREKEGVRSTTAGPGM